MSREVIIVRWCDGVHEQPEQAVVEHQVSIDGRKTRVIDLCSVCEDTFAPIERLVDRGVLAAKMEPVSRPVKVRTRTPPRQEQAGSSDGLSIDRPWPCPFAPPHGDCAHPGSPNRSAWGSHLRTVHSIGLHEGDAMLAEQGVRVADLVETR